MSPLAAYPSPAQRDARLAALAEALGAGVELIGESVQHRPIHALHLPASSAASGTSILITANIHGPEFVSSQVALGCLEACVAQDAAWVGLRERADLWVIPCLNPDGYAATYDREGRGPLAELRANARGVDLNRNYPLPTGARRWPFPGAGSSNPRAATYRGPQALSEPETAALARLAERIKPAASVGLHSFMGTVIPARVRDTASYTGYRQLAKVFAQAQPRWPYRRVASRHVDLYTGEQEDFLHHQFGCWSVCVETYSLRASFSAHLRAPSLFARFNPADPASWIANDVPGIAAYFDAALRLGPPERG